MPRPRAKKSSKAPAASFPVPTLNEGFIMAGELDALKAAVTRDTEVESSAVALLQGLKAALDAAIASNDPAALTALSASLGKSTDDLAAAVAANTPAA